MHLNTSINKSINCIFFKYRKIINSFEFLYKDDLTTEEFASTVMYVICLYWRFNWRSSEKFKLRLERELKKEKLRCVIDFDDIEEELHPATNVTPLEILKAKELEENMKEVLADDPELLQYLKDRISQIDLKKKYGAKKANNLWRKLKYVLKGE